MKTNKTIETTHKICVGHHNTQNTRRRQTKQQQKKQKQNITQYLPDNRYTKIK